jgi:hypothetical protein
MIQNQALITGSRAAGMSSRDSTVHQQSRPNPLIGYRSNRQIDEDRKKEAEEKEKKPELDYAEYGPLAAHIRKAWERNKMTKLRVQERLLANLRARRNEYSSTEISKMQAAGGMNFVWVDLTETKCRAGSAWIREVLMPVGERPFMVEPTPLPDIPPELKQTILAKALNEAKAVMANMMQAGGGVMDRAQFSQVADEANENLRDEVHDQYIKRARKYAERMEQKIADDMAEGGWEVAMDGFIEDFVTHPAAVLKGPFMARKKKLAWAPGWKPIVINEPVRQWKWIDVFDVYPDQSSIDCQRGNFIYRERFTRQDLYDLIGVETYKEDQIRQVLDLYSEGRLESWMWSESERRELQNQTLFNFLSPQGIIDGLCFYGSVPGWMLLDWGLKVEEVDDPLKDYDIEAILIGQFVVQCSVNRDPLGRRPFWKASYDAVPGSFWGNSIPDLARTCQKMCNAAASALADNMGWCSGPMVWVHSDRLADGESTITLFPGKVFQLKSDASQGVNPGVGFFQPDANAKQLSEQISFWDLRADDATGIPRYTYGNERVGGAANTYSGLAMLMNNAAKGLRRAISNVDIHVIQQTVYSDFLLEMIHGKDDSVKCDATISPRGAAAILVKEAANQARMTFLNIVSSNPALMQLVGQERVAYILREVAKSLDISPTDAVPSEQEVRAQMQQMQAQQQAMMEAEQQARAKEIEIKEAETAGKLDLERAKIELERSENSADRADRAVQALARDSNNEQQRKPRALRHTYNADGDIVSSEVVD